MISGNLLDAIKEASDKEGIITFRLLNLKLNKYDRKAIEILESLQDYSVGEGIEILQTAICWAGILNSAKDANKEIGEARLKLVYSEG